jgi:hypothetical protein
VKDDGRGWSPRPFSVVILLGKDDEVGDDQVVENDWREWVVFRLRLVLRSQLVWLGHPLYYHSQLSSLCK